MSDYKPERLSKLAREFNSSVSSLAEYLNKNGITIDANPNTKIDAEGYQVLAKHFAPDKQLREAAEKRALDRPVKEPIKEVVKEKPPVVEEKPAEKEIVKPVAEEKIAKEVPIIESKEEKSEEVKPAAKKTKEKKETKEVEEVLEIAEEKVTEKSEPTVIEGKAKIGGLKIKGKIELEEKPKRKTKKQLEEEAAAEKAEAKKSSKKKKETPVEPEEVAVEEVKKEEQKLQEVPPEVVAPVVETSTPVEPEIIKPKFEKLAGLNVIGKMELPVNDPNKNKDKDKDKEAEKKKRKRKTNNYVGGSDSKTFKTDPNNDRRPDPNRPIVPANRRPIPGGGDRNKPKRDNAEITDKEIQDKIKETLSRLSAGTGLTSNRSKLRRQKRDSHAADHEEKMAQMDLEAKTLKVTEFVSANDLANMMDVAVTEVITACMSLGMMVSINQRLDAETISIVAEEFGYKVSFVEVDGQDDFVEPEDDPADLVERAPIVTVMGHVDHGKTTLLDFIRNANVAGGEAGGITQHLGAYEVKLENGKKITFLDTPGHEAFTAMRARGAKLTDIVIIVVAADDSVMPQTKEAIAHAQAAGVPIVIAINKIDKEGAAPDRVREQLSQLNVLVEEWGGKVQSQEISAKKGINIDKLLEKVLLEAEYLNLKANPKKAAIGTVVEASLEKGRGTVTTMMVQAGTLNKGDTIVAGQHYAKIRAMFNEWGKNIESAGPSTPVKVLGFTGAPQAGDVFKVFADESMAKEISIKRQQLLREQTIRTQKHITLDEIGRRLAIGNFKELKLIVKGDVDGSVQALTDSFLKLTTPEISVNVIMRGVGAISESDVLLASASDAVIIGFNVRPSLQAKKLAETEGIDIHFYSIIYDAINEVKAAMEGMLAPTVEEKIVCNVEIREVFEISKVGTIAGCMVRDGKIERKTKIRIIRDGVVIHTGELASLKRFKDDVKEVSTGYECGLSINNFNNIQVGDIVEGYELVEKKRTL